MTDEMLAEQYQTLLMPCGINNLITKHFLRSINSHLS